MKWPLSCGCELLRKARARPDDDEGKAPDIEHAERVQQAWRCPAAGYEHREDSPDDDPLLIVLRLDAEATLDGVARVTGHRVTTCPCWRPSDAARALEARWALAHGCAEDVEPIRSRALSEALALIDAGISEASRWAIEQTTKKQK